MADREFTLNITGPEGQEAGFEIPIGVTRIGRQAGSGLMLAHTQVSRQHARLETTADTCEIIDIGSSNGTYVNDEKLTKDSPVGLKNNDRIKIGPFRILVRVQIKEDAGTGTLVEEQAPADPSIVSEVREAPEEPEKAAVEEEEAEAEEPEEVEAPEESQKDKTQDEKAEEKEPAGEQPPADEDGAGEQKAPAREPAQEPPPAPPPDPPGPPPGRAPVDMPDEPASVPGLTIRSSRLLGYLPGIYHSDFMARFLGIFEATLLPIEWTVDHFDLFLSAGTAPTDFMPWLASWYGLTFDSTWTEEMRRTLVAEAHRIYARRGTRWALCRVLEIYTGAAPEIDDQAEDLDPFTFTVEIPVRKRDVDADLVESLIDAHKPAHTSYIVRYGG